MKKEENKWGGAREGAGRSSLYKGERKQKITLSLTEKAVEVLNYLAESQGVSRSDFLNKILLKSDEAFSNIITKQK